MAFVVINSLLSFCLSGCHDSLAGQKYTSPDKQKQFNLTVNYEDYTVKTQMLSVNADIRVNNERTYMWYGSQKIIETKGGFNGKLIHGRYNAYYLNGQLKEQGLIKYGLKHKEWKYWYPDGKLKEIITWKAGVKHGEYLLYNDDGQLMAKSYFKNDKLHGKFLTFGPGGKLAEKKVYKNGDELQDKPQLRKEKEFKTKEIEEEGKEEKKKGRKRKKNVKGEAPENGN